MQKQIFKQIMALLVLTATLLLSTSLHALNKFEIEQFYTTLAQSLYMNFPIKPLLKPY